MNLVLKKYNSQKKTEELWKPSRDFGDGQTSR